jgi:hypothetical protein
MRHFNSRFFMLILAVSLAASVAFGQTAAQPAIASVLASYASTPSSPLTTSVTAGVSGLMLTVTGTNFALNYPFAAGYPDGSPPQSQLVWVPSAGGCPIASCVFSVIPTSLTQFVTSIPDALIAGADPGATLVVLNPGNVASPAFPFPVNPKLTTTAVPQAWVNVPYAAYITTGGTPVYTVNAPFTGGVPGLSPTGSALGGGRIMGTPTLLGTFSGAATVLDAWGQTSASHAYAVNVGRLPTAEQGLPYLQQSPFVGVGPYIFTITSGSLPPGISLIFANQMLSLVGTPTASGAYTAAVRVDSPPGNTVTTGSIVINVLTPPAISTASLGPMTPGGYFEASVIASGGLTPYTWSLLSGSLPTGLSLNPTTGLINGVPTGSASTFTIKVTDQAGLTSTKTYFLDYVLQLTPTTLPAGQLGTTYIQYLGVSGGTGSYTCSFGPGAPSWLYINPPCMLGGPPPSAGTFTFTVQVADKVDGQFLTQQYALVINPLVLTVTTASPLPATPLGAISIPLAAAGGYPPYKWSVTSGSLPPGASLSTAGVVTGATTAQGSFTFTATVTDSVNGTASKSFTVSIIASVLTITTAALPNGFGQTAYSATVGVAGGVPPYKWSANGLPSALTINSSTGVISGTPGPQGTFSFTVTVTDSAGATKTAAFTIAVTIGPLQITSVALPSGNATIAYTTQLTASGGVLPYTWMPVGQIPAGFVVLSNGTLSGVYPQFAVLSFPVRVVDGQGDTADALVGLKINPAPLVISPATLPGGTAGGAYTPALSATGGVPPFTWTASLPAGLTINPATGAISGASLVGGPQTLVVTVTDITGISTTITYSVTFAMQPLPAVTFGPVPGVPATGPKLVFSLASLYPLAITGTATIAFKPDGSVTDPSVVFISGKNTLPFTIPVGSGSGTFAAGANFFQTGTLVGNITITLSLQAGGLDITPSPAPSLQIRIPPLAPVITSVTGARNGGIVTVTAQGYSDTREMVQGFFLLGIVPGSNVTPNAFTLPMSSIFATFYSGSSSATTGGGFLLTQQFAVMGNTSQIQTVGVSLTNSIGVSNSMIVPLQLQ